MQFGLTKVIESQVYNTVDGEITEDAIQLWVLTDSNDTILLSFPHDQARSVALAMAAHLGLEIYPPEGT